SLSAAARAADTPKATVSHQLKRLENELGVDLFVRKSNKLILSDIGLTFLEDARKIRRSCELGLDRIQDFKKKHGKTLRIGSSGVFTSNFIAPLILHFARRHPELSLEVTTVTEDGPWNSFDNMDCVFYLGYPPLPQASELTLRPFGKFSFGLYAS